MANGGYQAVALMKFFSNPKPYLGTSANPTIVTTEWNTLFLQCYILQIFGGFSDVHTLNSLGCLPCVLKGRKKVLV